MIQRMGNSPRKGETKPDSVRITSDEQREQLMVQAAKLYYEMQLTQHEIAKQLCLTRWKVGKLLTDAKETGLVRIQIVRTPSVCRRWRVIFRNGSN
jgi:deoxyribonucleoside regulator